jgi:diaminobutyrate-2-oxoglutarate transaminase
MNKYILQPREMHYKMQFTGPTGTNAVEAAFKLARKITGRNTIVAFTNAFHGVTLGSVAATGNSHFRDAAGVGLDNVTFMPYDGYMGEGVNTLDYFRKSLEDNSSGLDLPAAVVVETVQGEGGINVASIEWLQELAEICEEHEILLIVDDIQMGCGRTGTFFSFEEAGIEPDIITLSKSLSGFGLPFSLVLMKPKYDQWAPGEHNGTFRGHNLAFVTAEATIKRYWADKTFNREIQEKSKKLATRLKEIVASHTKEKMEIRGKGLIYGIDCANPDIADTVKTEAFKNGLIIETSGSDDQVIKFMPPLNIEMATLDKGLDIFAKSLTSAINFVNETTEEESA